MNSDRLVSRVLKPALFLAALIPFALLLADAFGGRLGANPVETITHRTGDWTLRMLLVTLAVTPMRRLTGWNALARLRRMLGLYAFFYACLHFLTYIWLDQFFDLGAVVEDVVKRPYITVGFTTFLLLLPLAATSTNAMARRLGGRRWRRLHRLAYVTAAGGILHFLWLVKADLREPAIYLAVFAILMTARIPPVARQLGDVRVWAGSTRPG